MRVTVSRNRRGSIIFMSRKKNSKKVISILLILVLIAGSGTGLFASANSTIDFWFNVLDGTDNITIEGATIRIYRNAERIATVTTCHCGFAEFLGEAREGSYFAVLDLPTGFTVREAVIMDTDNVTHRVVSTRVYLGTIAGGNYLLIDVDWFLLRGEGAPPPPQPPPPPPPVEEPSPWAVSYMNTAIAAGLVPQNLQSAFTKAITRAEFASLAVALFESQHGEITGRSVFADTNDVNVQKAAYIGVVLGVGDNRFNPNGTLTREQAATILVRLSDALGLGNPLPNNAAAFADNALISSWAITSVGRVQAAGIMGGVGDNRFAPAGTYTREQSIVTIMRLIMFIQNGEAPTPPQDTAEVFARRIFELTNAERERYGLNTLLWCDYLAEAARLHSEDMARANQLSHRGTDGSTIGSRLINAGVTFRGWAENVGMGQHTPELMVQAWMNSPSHRANILNENMIYLGVGVFNATGLPGGYFCTQKFVTPQVDAN